MNRAGTYAGLLQALADGDTDVLGGSAAKLRAAQDYLAVAGTVVEVVRDIPIGDVVDALPREPADPEALLTLARTWGVESSVERVLHALGWTGD